MNDGSNPIIFFDGVCGLCNRFVDFVIRRDKKKKFMFAPLQGTTANEYNISLEKYNSVVLWQNDKILIKSSAAIAILAQLPGLLRLTKVLLIIPKMIRDWFYDLVAHKRYQWFGRKEVCRIPSKEEQARFRP